MSNSGKGRIPSYYVNENISDGGTGETHIIDDEESYEPRNLTFLMFRQISDGPFVGFVEFTLDDIASVRDAKKSGNENTLRWHKWPFGDLTVVSPKVLNGRAVAWRAQSVSGDITIQVIGNTV